MIIAASQRKNEERGGEEIIDAKTGKEHSGERHGVPYMRAFQVSSIVSEKKGDIKAHNHKISELWKQERKSPKFGPHNKG